MSDGPYVASPTFTDFTTYVRSISIHRGRSGEGDFETGTAQIVLDNRSRLFDPFYTSGTYYGNLLPNRQIRIRSTIGVTTYDVFRGYVSGWPVKTTAAGFDSTVTLQCFDAFGLLNDDHIPEDWSRYLIELSSPVSYYPGNDPEGSVITDRGSQGLNLSLLVGTKLTEFDSLGQGLAGTSVNVIGSLYQNLPGTFTEATTGDITIMTWYAAAQPNATSIMLNQYGLNGSIFHRMRIEPNLPTLGQLRVTVTNNATGLFSQANTANLGLNTFAPQHVAATYTNATGAIQIYINGTLSTTQTATQSGIELLPTHFLEYAYTILQETAIFSSVLTAAQINAIYSVGASNLVEATNTRAARVLATTSFPIGLTSTSGTFVNSCAEITNGGSVIPELQLIANTEGGDVFVTKAGVIKLTDRNYIFTNTNSNTTQATFSDAIPYVSLKYGTELGLELNSDDIGNFCTVSLSGGGEVSATVAASVSSFGTQAYNIASQSATVAGAQALADFDVVIRSKLRATVSPLEVSVTDTDADWSTLLGLELLERFSVTRTPATGNAITQVMLVSAIDHTITPGDWNMVLTGSTRQTGYFILDKSSLDGTDVLFG